MSGIMTASGLFSAFGSVLGVWGVSITCGKHRSARRVSISVD